MRNFGRANPVDIPLYKVVRLECFKHYFGINESFLYKV